MEIQKLFMNFVKKKKKEKRNEHLVERCLSRAAFIFFPSMISKSI